MVKKLRDLHATLMNIETKGNNTIIMADCLRFLDQCINESIKEYEETERKLRSQQEEIENIREKLLELEAKARNKDNNSE